MTSSMRPSSPTALPLREKDANRSASNAVSHRVTAPSPDADSLTGGLPDETSRDEVLRSSSSGRREISVSPTPRFPTRVKAKLALGAIAFVYNQTGHFIPDSSELFQDATRKYQGVVDQFSRKLGIEPPRFIVHRSNALLSPYAGLPRFPLFDFGGLISIGSSPIVQLPESSVKCWVAHEVAHFCEKKSDNCQLPVGLADLEIDGTQAREKRADLIGAYLCGQQAMLDTLDDLRRSEYSLNLFGTRYPVHHLFFRAFSSHGSAQQRMEQVHSHDFVDPAKERFSPQNLIKYFLFVAPVYYLLTSIGQLRNGGSAQE